MGRVIGYWAFKNNENFRNCVKVEPILCQQINLGVGGGVGLAIYVPTKNCAVVNKIICENC